MESEFIAQLIDLGITGQFLWASLPGLDLIGTQGETCAPQRILNVTDLQLAALCVEGMAYENLICPDICP